MAFQPRQSAFKPRQLAFELRQLAFKRRRSDANLMPIDSCKMQNSQKLTLTKCKSLRKQAGAELGQAQPKLGLWLAQAETYGLAQPWSMVEPKLNCSGFGLN